MSLSFHLRGHERARSSHAVRIQRREKLLSVRVDWGKSHTEVELGGTLMGGNSWRKRVGTSPGGAGGRDGRWVQGPGDPKELVTGAELV